MTTSCTQCDFKTTSDYYQSSHTSIILSASSHKWLLPFCPRLLGFWFLALLKLKETEWKTTASLFASSRGSCQEKYVSHSIIWKDTGLDLRNPSLCLAPCPLPCRHSELPVFPLNLNICSVCRHLPDNDFLYNDSCHSCCKQSLLSDSNNGWHTILMQPKGQNQLSGILSSRQGLWPAGCRAEPCAQEFAPPPTQQYRWREHLGHSPQKWGMGIKLLQDNMGIKHCTTPGAVFSS